jgi:hypothetical protein
MPVRATCPNGHTLNLDDKFAGKKVRCPRCSAVIAVPGAGVARPSPVPASVTRRRDNDEDRGESDHGEEPLTQEERARLRRETKRFEAGKILLGIVFYVAKTDHLAAMPILIGFFGFAFWLLGNEGDALKAKIFGVTYAFLASTALQGLIASIFWIFAPKKSNARGMAIATAICEFIALLAFGLMAWTSSDISNVEKQSKARPTPIGQDPTRALEQLVPITGSMGLELTQLKNLEAFLFTVIVVTVIGSVIFFLVALRGLSNFYGDPLLGARAMQILVWILADLLLKALGAAILALLFNWLFQPTTDAVLFVPLLLVAVAGTCGLLAVHLLIYIKLVLLLYNEKKLVARKL